MIVKIDREFYISKAADIIGSSILCDFDSGHIKINPDYPHRFYTTEKFQADNPFFNPKDKRSNYQRVRVTLEFLEA